MLQYVFLEHPFFAATSLLYLGATLVYALAWVSPARWPGRAGTALMVAGVALNAAVIVGRWLEAGRAPFKSLFESLVFFAFCIALLYVIFERLYKTRLFAAAGAGHPRAVRRLAERRAGDVGQLHPAAQHHAGLRRAPRRMLASYCRRT